MTSDSNAIRGSSRRDRHHGSRCVVCVRPSTPRARAAYTHTHDARHAHTRTVKWHRGESGRAVLSCRSAGDGPTRASSPTFHCPQTRYANPCRQAPLALLSHATSKSRRGIKANSRNGPAARHANPNHLPQHAAARARRKASSRGSVCVIIWSPLPGRHAAHRPSRRDGSPSDCA